jgi:hypothetical protein
MLLIMTLLLVVPGYSFAFTGLSSSSTKELNQQDMTVSVEYGDNPPQIESTSHASVWMTSTSDFVLQTADGLSIMLSDAGQIKSISIDNVTISYGTLDPLAVADVNAGTYDTMGGSVVQVGQTYQQTATKLQFDLNLTYIAYDNYIKIIMQADNVGAADRAADLCLRMPVSKADAHWWQGPNQEIDVSASGNYEYVKQSTADIPYGYHKMSWLPWSVVRVGVKGLCMAVLLNYPGVFFSGYSASQQQMYCNFSVGFSNYQTMNPGFAQFGLILYKVDARWGIRSAASRYYGFFPKWFTTSRAVGGTEAINGPLSVPESGMLTYKHADLIGLRFPYGGLYGPVLIYEGFVNSAYGVNSLPYLNPVGIRLSCTQAQYNAKNYIAVLNMYASSSDEINRTAATFIRNTLARNSTYDPMVQWSKDSLDVDFICDPILIGHSAAYQPAVTLSALSTQGTSEDIVVRDLLDFYSKWYVMPSYEDHDPYGAGPAGIFFDNVGAGWDNRNVTHFAYTTMPLSYDRLSNGTRIPVSNLAHTQVELLWALRTGIDASYYKNMTIYGNIGSAWPYGMFQVPFLDGGLQEQELLNWGFGGGSYDAWGLGMISRFLMYQKPISGMDYKGSLRTWTQISSERYLAYGMYPLMTGNFSRDDDLYQKYMPIADSLQKAGWGPVTYASVSNTGSNYVTMERFGHWYANSLHFTVHNWNGTVLNSVTASIEADSLAIDTQGMTIRELMTGQSVSYNVASNRITFTFSLGYNETKVFRLYKPVYGVPALAFDVPNPELPSQVKLISAFSTSIPAGAPLPTVRFIDNGNPLVDVASNWANTTYLYATTLITLGSGYHSITVQILDTASMTTPGYMSALAGGGGSEVSFTLPFFWPYRILITVDPGDIQRHASYARVPINFEQVRSTLGITSTVDFDSLRMVDPNGNPVVLQWLGTPHNPESGVLVFPFSQDAVTVGATNVFKLYFDTVTGTPKPSYLQLHSPFKRVGPFGVQLADSTMILAWPVGANVYLIQNTPDEVAKGYTLNSQAHGEWAGHLGAYERFAAKVVDEGPCLVRLAFTHGPEDSYSSFGCYLDIYATGVVEFWAYMNYSSQVTDAFTVYRQYEWTPPNRTGFYMGPDGTLVTVRHGEHEDPITDFTEPWFGQIDTLGRYSFTVALDPVPANGMIDTWYNADAVRFQQNTFNVSQLAVYHLVYVAGVGTAQSAISSTREWLNMSYTLVAEAITTEKPDFTLFIVVGAGAAMVVGVAGLYIYGRRQGTGGKPEDSAA